MPEWLGLDGQRALVAGGAGTLGAAVVEGFLNAGAKVAVVDVSADGLARLDQRAPVRLEADLSDPIASRAAVASAREELGGLTCSCIASGSTIAGRLRATARSIGTGSSL